MDVLDNHKQKAKLNAAISRARTISPRLIVSCSTGNIDTVIDRGVQMLEGKITSLNA